MDRKLDHLFGGKPGAAENARSSMRKTYGAKGGDEGLLGHRPQARAQSQDGQEPETWQALNGR